MQVTVTKLTTPDLLREAASSTSGAVIQNIDLAKWYLSEHSPIRTQLFWVKMQDIPSFVSVHFVRHKIGVEHFVRTGREDRGGAKNAGRLTPVNHAMLLNAATLIAMSRKRRCSKASIETQRVMHLLREAIRSVDPDLADAMVIECEYRQRCPEFKSCGYWESKHEKQVHDRN